MDENGLSRILFVLIFGMDLSASAGRRIGTRDELESLLEAAGSALSTSQRSWFEQASEKEKDVLPFLVTSGYLQTALGLEGAEREALLRQMIPQAEELHRDESELDDPLGEQRFMPVPRLVHRYPDRALLLVTDHCASYCRHCFRRSFSGGMRGPVSPAEMELAVEYTGSRPEIRELLLSGGDPLTLADGAVADLIGRFRAVRPDLVIRICSRMPVVLPERISPALCGMLSDFSGLWFVTHFNHPSELTAESAAAADRLLRAGIPVLNQTVLLAGVNDNAEVLALLFNGLLQAGIKPYYIFQADLAAGTAHLRVPLERSAGIVSELGKMVSGMAMPRFAVDLPGGGGKITLPVPENLPEVKNGYYIFRGTDDEEYGYPAD